MAVVLREQAVASTSVDRHGERISEADLRQLLASMPPERPLYDNHDYLKPPVGRVSDCRLKRLEDGVLAIVCDIEIFNEEQVKHWQGFSIGVHRAEVEADAAPTEFAISFLNAPHLCMRSP